ARVEGVIEKRIGRLQEELLEILSVASVEGEDFTAQVVARVQAFRERQLLRALSRELEKRHHLVRERGEVRVNGQSLSQYRFAHVLIQQYVYNALSAGERRLLHGEVAEVLEDLYGDQAEEIAVQLAYHFTQGEVWGKAFRYLVLSGNKARQAHASREAIAFYTQAEEVNQWIKPALDEQQLLPVYEGRGLVWQLLTQYDEAIADFQTMRRLARVAGNRQKEGESLCHLAYTHWLMLSENQMPFVEQYAQEALQLFEQTRDQHILARSLTLLGSVDQARGHLPAADRKLEAALQISRQLGDKDSRVHTLAFLCLQAYLQGKYRPAIEYGQEGVAVAREVRDGFDELRILAFLSQSCWGAGHYAQARSVLQEGMTLARERENSFIAGRLLNTLGWFHNELGDAFHAAEYNNESIELGRASGLSHVEISALVNLCFDYLALGQYDQARSQLAPTLERIRREGFGAHKWRWQAKVLLGLAEHAYATGAYEDALRYVEAGLKEAQVTSSHKYVAKGLALQGKIMAQLGDVEAAGADLQRALAIAERLQSPTLLYPIAYDLGRWYAAAGREQEAAKLYGRANATIEHIASDVEDEALRAVFLQSTLVQTIKERA
ncbi:MAG: hypothetical protein D6791_00980, partial [Chloroflexi bacterium]